METEQRAIIWYLFQGNSNANDIQEASGTVHQWHLQPLMCSTLVSIHSAGRENFHDDTRSTRPPTDFIDTKILSALESAISFCVLTR
jgi:hypothetical protein